MTHKVFLVEDEIVTREGIRDNVDWASAGFEFCGEAPDGELALPLIQTIQPDVVITDIKMPFMDGLQLCCLIKEYLPHTRTIILSGHDEFKYAQEAIKVGVTEYLLKPVGTQDLLTVLHKMARQIDREKGEKENLQRLRDQVAEQFSETDAQAEAHKLALLKLDSLAVAQFLKHGAKTEVDDFFTSYLEPLGEPNLVSPLVIHYIVTHLILSAANFVRELGSQPEVVIPEINHLGKLLAGIQSLPQVKAQVGKVLLAALTLRDSQTYAQRTLIKKATDYIEAQYASPEISLNAVAAQVNLSPSYFSVVFSREVGETFIEYLTRVRIHKAKELIRTTALTCSEIGYRVGYNNPRYFSSVFKKAVGLSPVEFRDQARV
jgi:two-component system, response regulator YesN